MNYLIMNKNEKIAKFSVEDTDYGKFYRYLDIIPQRLPFKLLRLEEFIKSRTVIIDRYGLKDKLAEVGIRDSIDLINLTYGVSMVDTFWIKQEDDKRLWENVSPFNRDLQFDLSWFFKNPKDDSIYKGIPDYSTDGNFPKCWINIRNINMLIKCGTSGAYNAGLEPLSEVLFPQIAEKLQFNNYVRYKRYDVPYSKFSKHYKAPGLLKELIDIKEGKRFASLCRCFTDENHGLVTVKELGLQSIEEIIIFAKEHCINWKDICNIYLTDALGFNEDRHNGNIGFIFDTNTFEIFRVAPMYDNNLSLLCYYDDREDLQEYVSQLRAKGDIDFIDLARKMLEYIPEKEQFVKDISKNFQFNCDFRVNTERLSMLSNLVQNQAKRII